MPRIGAAHRHRDREAGRHQLWSPLRWPASTRLPSCAAAAHRPGPHGRRPSPAPRSFDGGLVSLRPTRPGHPHRPITIARVLVPRLRSIRLLSRPGPTGWPMLRTACAGPHRTLIHSDRGEVSPQPEVPARRPHPGHGARRFGTADRGHLHQSAPAGAAGGEPHPRISFLNSPWYPARPYPIPGCRPCPSPLDPPRSTPTARPIPPDPT